MCIRMMNKFIVPVNLLFKTNQNTILHYYNCIPISYYWCNVINKPKSLYPSVIRQNSYFVNKDKPNCNYSNTVKRTLSSEISNIEDEEAIVSRNYSCDLEEEITLSSNRLRCVLYPDSKDPVISQLKLCRTVQKVFEIIHENEQNFNHERCSQAILILWDLQKIYEYANSTDDSLNENITLQETDLLGTYKTHLNKHPSFNNLLQLTSLTYKEMTADALSCSFLYLRRMGVSLTNDLMQNLVLHLKYLLDTIEPPQFPLTALSRFSVGMYYDKDLRATITLVATLPHIISSLSIVDSVEDLRTLTISLRAVISLIDPHLFTKYKMTIDQFIDKGKLTSEDLTIIFKVLLLLDQPFWGQENIITLRKILLLFCGSTKCLSESQISFLQKMINHYLEPYPLLVELEANSGHTLANYKIGGFYPNESFVVAVTSGKHYRGMLVAQEIVSKAVSIQSLVEVFPFISTIDMDTCNKYWMKMLTFLQLPTDDFVETQLFIVSSRYLFFSFNMSWYRNIAFEKKLIQLLMERLVEGMAEHIPYQFAHISSFLLAYDQPTAPSMPKQIVSKLLEFMNQFSVYDCENISKGLRIAMDIRRRGNITQEFLQQFVSLDAALNSRAIQLLNEEENHSLHRLNKIMRAYIHRKGNIDTELFQRIIKNYEAIEECNLSSRSLRDTVYNLLATNCLIPDLIDKLVSYCIKQKEHIIGDTVCKLIYSTYCLGYTPVQGEEFFAVASHLITRDKERLSGLGLLQACLALCYFVHLPPPLIQFIFTVGFLEHLDEEIKHCFAKTTYPVRIRRCLMELNRAVCLDQPEAGVPWFHAKYCEEQHALGLQEHSNNSSFHSNVYHTLTMASGSKDYIQKNVSSPYGYSIDFQMCFDQDHKLVDPRKADTSSLNKVAILLQNCDSFTTNVQKLKGYNQMKQRHLEIMGYKVISINDALWNAMYMAEPKAKLNYVTNLIWTHNS